MVWGRKAIEWAEHAHFLAWLSGQWTVIVNGAVAAILSYWASITEWIAKYGYLPIVLIGMFAFAVGIWITNGIIWLRQQRRPSKERIAFDYSYSLAITDVMVSLDLNNPTNTLELRPRLKNSAARAIKYEFDKLEFRIEDRFVAGKPKGAVLAPDSSLTVIPRFGFNQAAWNSFKSRTNGSIVGR